jgi:hypothetical protein
MKATDQARFEELKSHIEANKEIAHETDYMALEYNNPATSDKRRGEIYLYFMARFGNLVKGKVNKYLRGKTQAYSDYKEEAWSIWTYMVGKKLIQWTARGTKHDFLHFLAYLAPYAEKGVVSELNEKVAYKDGRYSSISENDATADLLNGIIDNDLQFRAYEASLISKAFDTNKTIIEGDLFSIVNGVDQDVAVDEIDGYYIANNANQWDTMADSYKHESNDSFYITGRTAKEA